MINDLTKEAHETAVSHGWWDSSRNALECLALIHAEVSEAVEAYRDGNETRIVEELADVLIRVFDLCGQHQWDLQTAVLKKMEVNKSRSYRHGNKVA